jgi:hypothetical protein
MEYQTLFELEIKLDDSIKDKKSPEINIDEIQFIINMIRVARRRGWLSYVKDYVNDDKNCTIE